MYCGSRDPVGDIRDRSGRCRQATFPFAESLTSKLISRCKLDQSWRSGGINSSKQGRAHISVWEAQVCTIEDIEKFYTELEEAGFCDRQIFMDTRVKRDKARAPDDIAPGVPILKIRDCEGIGIKPSLRGASTRQISISYSVGPAIVFCRVRINKAAWN